jgi:hypothetical protein
MTFVSSFPHEALDENVRHIEVPGFFIQVNSGAVVYRRRLGCKISSFGPCPRSPRLLAASSLASGEEERVHGSLARCVLQREIDGVREKEEIGTHYGL